MTISAVACEAGTVGASRAEPAVSGAAVPVLEDVNVSSFLLANLVWSLNGTLVYVQGTGASNETELVRVDRHRRSRAAGSSSA